MATAPQVQTLESPAYANSGSSHWLGCTASPKEEARALFAMIGRNGVTVESIRELILVPPEIERTLRVYGQRHPEDAEGVERILKFRQRVTQQFERLANLRAAPHNQIESKPTE